MSKAEVASMTPSLTVSQVTCTHFHTQRWILLRVLRLLSGGGIKEAMATSHEQS